MGLAKTFLAIGISLLFTVFFAYAVYVVYEPPVYAGENTCYTNYSCYTQTEICNIKYNCGGYYYPKSAYATTPLYNETLNETEFQSCMDKQQKCILDIQNSAEYKQCFENQDACLKESRKTDPSYIYARNTFYIFVAISLITLIIGMYLIRFEGIGSGLIGGAILLVFWNIGYSWSYVHELNKYLRLFLIGLVLALLIYLGYKRIEKASSGKKKKKGKKR